MDRLSVPEAAERLGLTRDAVYKRVQRDQIPWDKEPDGKVYVYVEQSNTEADWSTDAVQNRVVLIETLHEEVEAWREESKRKDTIIAQMNQTIAALTQRIPELEPVRETPSEPPESTVSDSETQAKGAVPQDSAESEIKRSWWRRFFGS